MYLVLDIVDYVPGWSEVLQMVITWVLSHKWHRQTHPTPLSIKHCFVFFSPSATAEVLKRNTTILLFYKSLYKACVILRIIIFDVFFVIALLVRSLWRGN